MSVKHVVGTCALVFAVVLAILVAKQMSTEAMAVVIGVVCGVAAGIPTSVLLLVALSRRDRRRLDDLDQRTAMGGHNYPPVVVIQGGTQPALRQGTQAGYWPASSSGPSFRREFHVVGGDDLLHDVEGYWDD